MCVTLKNNQKRVSEFNSEILVFFLVKYVIRFSKYHFFFNLFKNGFCKKNCRISLSKKNTENKIKKSFCENEKHFSEGKK